jgi:hypothetical protein
MIDLLLKHADDQAADPDLLDAIGAYEAKVLASSRGGDRRQVAAAEAAVRADPGQAFTFNATGAATLSAGGRTWHAGQFEAVPIGVLRARAAVVPPSANRSEGRVRLFVIEGTSPATDIGSLQADGGSDTLFQVASQFNCLESPGPYVTPVEQYFGDSTQGPRASISAFPGTLLRQYAAPTAGGRRFVQQTDVDQIELLKDVSDAGLARVRNGYLLPAGIADPEALATALEVRFDSIRVGVHDGVEAVLGYDWDGAVAGPDRPVIAQVFTSTIAGGIYGDRAGGPFETIGRQLLRAAYLGTLLAAVSLGRTRVVLTLIGGGVFCNPIPLIWNAIQWALREVDSLPVHGLDVVVNARNLGGQIDHETILRAVQVRGGVLLGCSPGGARVYR